MKKMVLTRLVPGMILFGLLFSVEARTEELRLWQNNQGDQFIGRFSRILLGKVMLETPDNKKLYIPLKDLSKLDHRYLSQIFIPEVKIRFSASSHAKFRSKNALPNDIIRIVQGTAIVESKDEVECCTLRVAACMIGEEVATDDFKLLKKGVKPLRFTKENEYACQMEMETISRKYEEYNRQIRGCLYAGYAVAVLDRDNNIVGFRSDVRWLTKDNFKTLWGYDEGTFFDTGLKERPVPRPKNTGIDRVGVQ